MWRGWPGSRSPRSPAPFGVWTGSAPRPVSACCGSPSDLHYVASPTATSWPPGAPGSSGSSHPSSPGGSSRPWSARIEKSLRARGHHVLLFDLEDDTYDQRLPLSQNMLWKRVDGVITLNVPMTDRGGRAGRPARAAPGRHRHTGARAGLRADRRPGRHAHRRRAPRGAGTHARSATSARCPPNVAHIQTPQDRLEAFPEACRRPRAGVRRRLDPGVGLDRRGGGRATRDRAALARPTGPPPSSRRPTRWRSGCMSAPAGSGCECPRTSRSSASTTTCSRASSASPRCARTSPARAAAAADLLLRALLDDDESRETDRASRPSSSCASRPAPRRRAEPQFAAVRSPRSASSSGSRR